MNLVKSKVFNYLTKNQKSDFCHYITSYVKKDFKKSSAEILENFLDDERHYLSINSSRFEWLHEYLENEEFLKDIELYIKENQRKCEHTELQRPIYEKQKEYARKQRKLAQERKMSKLPPTKAQVAFYEKLCKKYGIKKELSAEGFSRLDFKQGIEKILEANKK